MERNTPARTEIRCVHSCAFMSCVGTSRGDMTGSFMRSSIGCWMLASSAKEELSHVLLQERAHHLVGGKLWGRLGKVAMLRSIKSGIPRQ